MTSDGDEPDGLARHYIHLYSCHFNHELNIPSVSEFSSLNLVRLLG